MAGADIGRVELAEFIWESREEGFVALEHEVIYRELCSGCGLCVAACPEDVIGFMEYPRLIGKCTNCGYCLLACPRSFLPKREVEEKTFGGSGESVGVAVGVYAVRTEESGQDGGFVTALLKHMLKKGLIDGAVVSKIDPAKPWKPLPALATTAKGMEEAAGSRYSTSPNLSVLKEARKKGLKKVAVVGTPCHIDGIAKLRHYPVEGVELAEAVRYTISIFCKSNFIYPMLQEVLVEKHSIELKKVERFDIKGRSLLVFGDDEKIEVPLSEVREYVRLGCKVCDDFTGRLADFAVGSVGSPAGYSTVITRTEEADRILKDMEKEGIAEVQELSGEGLSALKRLAESNQSSARKAILRIVREELPMPLKFLWE